MSTQAMAWVLDSSESKGNARLVMIAIANHIGAKDGRGWVYVSQILSDANCEIDSYHRAVKKLVELGELEVELRAGGSRGVRNDMRPNMYYFPRFAHERPPQDAGVDESADAYEQVGATPADSPGRDPRELHTSFDERPPQDAHHPPPQNAGVATPAKCTPQKEPSLGTVREPSSSSTATETATEPSSDDDDQSSVLEQALDELARRDVERFAGPIGNVRSFTAACRRSRDRDHRATLHGLVYANQRWTAIDLADAIDGSTSAEPAMRRLPDYEPTGTMQGVPPPPGLLRSMLPKVG